MTHLENRVTAPRTPESRKGALDTYLADCARQGFRLESRTDTQAVIVQGGRLARFRKGAGSRRVVVWVDEHGSIEKNEIEARRW